MFEAHFVTFWSYIYIVKLVVDEIEIKNDVVTSTENFIFLLDPIVFIYNLCILVWVILFSSFSLNHNSDRYRGYNYKFNVQLKCNAVPYCRHVLTVFFFTLFT